MDRCLNCGAECDGDVCDSICENELYEKRDAQEAADDEPSSDGLPADAWDGGFAENH